MAITIPKLTTVRELSAYLNEPTERILAAVDFLKKCFLITQEKEILHPTNSYIFLDSKSPFITQHHRNWREKAIQSSLKKNQKNMHLSMVVTLSEKDSQILKNKIAEMIEDFSNIVKGSKEEKLMAIGLDFFEV